MWTQLVQIKGKPDPKFPRPVATTRTLLNIQVVTDPTLFVTTKIWMEQLVQPLLQIALVEIVQRVKLFARGSPSSRCLLISTILTTTWWCSWLIRFASRPSWRTKCTRLHIIQRERRRQAFSPQLPQQLRMAPLVTTIEALTQEGLLMAARGTQWLTRMWIWNLLKADRALRATRLSWTCLYDLVRTKSNETFLGRAETIQGTFKETKDHPLAKPRKMPGKPSNLTRRAETSMVLLPSPRAIKESAAANPSPRCSNLSRVSSWARVKWIIMSPRWAESEQTRLIWHLWTFQQSFSSNYWPYQMLRRIPRVSNHAILLVTIMMARIESINISSTQYKAKVWIFTTIKRSPFFQSCLRTETPERLVKFTIRIRPLVPAFLIMRISLSMSSWWTKQISDSTPLDRRSSILPTTEQASPELPKAHRVILLARQIKSLFLSIQLSSVSAESLTLKRETARKRSHLRTPATARLRIRTNNEMAVWISKICIITTITIRITRVTA